MISRRDFLAATAATAVAVSARASGRFAPSSSAFVCPKASTPARKLAVFDLRELTSFADDFRLTLQCLQGIVNRQRPRLFLIQDHYDELWLDWLRERGDIDDVERIEIGHVLERFVPEVGSMYITDPAIPASVNVATMLAGLDSALVANPAIAEQFDLSAGNLPDDSKVGYDLRPLHWKKDVDAYRWFFSLHEQRLSRSSVAMLDPSTSAIRDYLVAFKIPILWISSVADAAHNSQAAHQAEADLPANSFCARHPTSPASAGPAPGSVRKRGIGEWDGVRVGGRMDEACSASNIAAKATPNSSQNNSPEVSFFYFAFVGIIPFSPLVKAVPFAHHQIGYGLSRT
jgi:hypothetical protein